MMGKGREVVSRPHLRLCNSEFQGCVSPTSYLLGQCFPFIHKSFLDSLSPVLKYMGDYPSKRMRSVNELTDQIFEWARFLWWGRY